MACGQGRFVRTGSLSRAICPISSYLHHTSSLKAELIPSARISLEQCEGAKRYLKKKRQYSLMRKKFRRSHRLEAFLHRRELEVRVQFLETVVAGRLLELSIRLSAKWHPNDLLRKHGRGNRGEAKTKRGTPVRNLRCPTLLCSLRQTPTLPSSVC